MFPLFYFLSSQILFFKDTCEDEPVCVEEKKATSPKKEAEAQPVKQVEIKPAYKPAEPIKVFIFFFFLLVFLVFL